MDNGSTYLGKRGYTIYKSALSVDDQRWIRKTLNVTPYVPGSPVQPPSFDVYRESSHKLYIPRHFGIQHFGSPDTDILADPRTVVLEFAGELRDYQVPVVNSFVDRPIPHKCGIIDLPCGFGKTSCALNIISRLRVKTLVIVHKSFLMGQWEERIRQFLPAARIGRIQGETFDIDDKDIVMGMLQSLSMKTYPTDAFESFGLTIIDECHHIPSEVFSRALSTITTRHILGLSATVKRKDGLTKVLNMFVGEVVYSIKRKPQSSVEVRGIRFMHDDPEFGASITDYRGKIMHSSMITKLCKNSDRTSFISRLIEAEMKDNQQILVLSQNRNVLTSLGELLTAASVSCGFYVGGMKEKDLALSARKPVLLATYGMAAEGLDIKTLTTLVLATPRTDIVQAVGRILRSDHARPLIIDIIDTHECFQRQWEKASHVLSQKQIYGWPRRVPPVLRPRVHVH